MRSSSAACVIGILWRGQQEDRRPMDSHGLAPLFDAFDKLGVEIVPLPFEDVRAEEVRSQLDGLDGLLTWVNPIQDGANRKNVDDILHEASERGIFVSADPAVIMKMGTKEVLYLTHPL